MKWLFLLLLAVGAYLIWRAVAAADTPGAGADAPGFSLSDQDGKARSLADFRGQWLVLYFYPRDDTPGCTRQACAFRDDQQKLEAMGARVVGVSVNDVASHMAFAKKFSLQFPLLADTGGEVAGRYGSVYDFGVVKFARRNTFLIDPAGRIAKVYVAADASGNSQEVISDLQALRVNK